MNQIKFLVMDVDGTLTDGKIYMSDAGEMFKVFDIKDGYGIYGLLPRNEIIPIVITARNSMAVKNRCTEIGISEVHQGVKEKMNCLRQILEKYIQQDETNYGLENVAYIGDDLLDLQCILPINENGGMTACPADAVLEVQKAAGYICSKAGGNGAVREFIEFIINKE